MLDVSGRLIEVEGTAAEIRVVLKISLDANLAALEAAVEPSDSFVSVPRVVPELITTELERLLGEVGVGRIERERSLRKRRDQQPVPAGQYLPVSRGS
jgi:hypothetical protein